MGSYVRRVQKGQAGKQQPTKSNSHLRDSQGGRDQRGRETWEVPPKRTNSFLRKQQRGQG